MVYSLIGTHEEELDYRNTDALIALLGFVNAKELKTFIRSNRFEPYFKEYAEAFIYPQQKEALQLGTSRGRGAQFSTVQERMIVGERLGSDKFSNPYPNKSDWDRDDHCANALFHICRANTKSASGIFFSKGLSAAQIHLRAWLLLKYEEYNHAPSKRNATKKALSGEVEAASSETGQSSTAFIPTPPLSERAAGKRAESRVASIPPPPSGPPSPTPPPPHFDREDTVMTQDTTYNDFDHNEDDHKEDEETNAQLMVIENGCKNFNIAERFWKAWLIDQLIQAGNDVEALQTHVDMVLNIDSISEEEQKAWFISTSREFEEDSIQYQKWDATASANFDERSAYFDSEIYQREDLEEACSVLEIPWNQDNTVFRQPGMNLSQRLMFWQPPAVLALVEFTMHSWMRACFLADSTGLGKTWIIVSYLLYQKKFREHALQDWELPAKPTLIIVPKHLITQWIKAIDLIAPNAFDVYKYHGDSRRLHPVANERAVHGFLHQSHELFDGKEQRSRTLVISSYSTFAARHGPANNKKYRANKLAMSRADQDARNTEFLGESKANIRGCFALVICDECHLIKTPSSDASLALQWLKAENHVMISATLIPNGITDWLGYMPFLEAADAKDWWSKTSLENSRFTSDMDPFSVPNEHPAARLRFTREAVKDWILSSRISPADKGLRLATMWRECVIRRTPQSRIPFRQGRKIADSLPRCKAAIINCSFNDEEQVQYDGKEKVLTGNLLTKDKKPKWSTATQRKLHLLTTSIHLPALDETENLKAVNLKTIFDHEQYFLKWFDVSQVPQMENPGPLLQQLLNCAPKLRALLRNVRSQVVRDQEKLLIFCQLPAVTVLLVAIFQLLAIDCVTLGAYQGDEERDAVIAAFTEHDDKAQVLITTYAVGSTGLNLQQKCWRVHLIESAHNLGVQAQAIGRALRVGNPNEVVYVYEYYVGNTWDDKAIWRNIEKAVPQAMAELNRRIFSGESDDADFGVDIGDWVFRDGEMLRVDQVNWQPGEKPHILSPHEVLKYILLQGKGEEVAL